MPKHEKPVDILVISISSPLLIGIYRDNSLIDKFVFEGKTSEVLPKAFKTILNNSYEINDIYYANGPGSYMSIKIAYTFLKTLSIVKGYGLKGAEAFLFNDNTPIKALGKKYFINDEKKGIIVGFLDKESMIKEFKLPENLDKKLFSDDALPKYHLPAV